MFVVYSCLELPVPACSPCINLGKKRIDCVLVGHLLNRGIFFFRTGVFFGPVISQIHGPGPMMPISDGQRCSQFSGEDHPKRVD